MSTIALSPQELQAGQPSAKTVQHAVQLVKVNGYAILEQAVPLDLIERLRARFMQVFTSFVERTDPNRGENRYQMHLPFQAPFVDPMVVSNPFAMPVVDQLLGADCVCHYFASDTPLPGSGFQKVHADIGHLFPEAGVSLPPYSVVVNIPLVDFQPDNGPLEIWPGGTHLFPPGSKMEELAPAMHSQCVMMQAGSVLIRDMRMWHRGTPNRSQEARPNMAMIYSRPWLKTHYPPIKIARETYDALPERARKLFRLEEIGTAAAEKTL